MAVGGCHRETCGGAQPRARDQAHAAHVDDRGQERIDSGTAGAGAALRRGWDEMTTAGNDASRRSALALLAALMMSGCAASNGSASAPTAALSLSRVPLSSSAAIWF